MDEKSRRKEPRESRGGTAEVLVLESPFAGMKDMKLDADLVEVSDSGLRLECDELLDQCVLQMKVSVDGAADTVSLCGEVRWVSFDQGGNYEMGVELTGNDQSLLDSWHNILKAR